VVRFRRWRLNVPEAWKAFEVAFGRAMPQAAGLMGLIFESLGKDRDPKIELRADLLRLIGDDLIACEFSPAMKPPAPLYALPSVVLVASPNPEQLATTVAKTLISLPFTPQTVETQQVGNLGVYSLRVPGTGTNEIPPVTLQWGPWSNWLAFSTRTGLLERLRPTAGARLVDAPGLEEATREVGGSEHGVFGYTDVRQLVGFTWTRFKQNPNNLDRWIDRSGLETFFPENAKEWRNWVDVTLLPPFESVERWFGFTVLNQVLTDDGIALRFLTPTPGREAGPNPAKPAEATATP
jgi:hypothetical protein